MAELILGPLLRYVGSTEATIWVETDAACEVEVLGRTARTLLRRRATTTRWSCIEDLEPGSSEEYEVALDGERVWPPPDSEFPPSVLRTFREEEQIELVFGSCRRRRSRTSRRTRCPRRSTRRRAAGSTPCTPSRSRCSRRTRPAYPDLLFLCGDQVYADEVSPATLEFIAERDGPAPPTPRPTRSPTSRSTRASTGSRGAIP